MRVYLFVCVVMEPSVYICMCLSLLDPQGFHGFQRTVLWFVFSCTWKNWLHAVAQDIKECWSREVFTHPKTGTDALYKCLLSTPRLRRIKYLFFKLVGIY